MTTVPASIPVLHWAAQRARSDDDAITRRFRKWPQWLSGESQPTLKQLEDFARLTHTAIGYFFLPQPPVLPLPLPDFRTLRDAALAEPSPELLDTIYLCQQRQDWYREYAMLHWQPALTFVGSARLQDRPEDVASAIRQTLGLSIEARQRLSTWEAALRQMVAQAEEAGILVMVSGIVGNNGHRKLSVDEFRGFALVDSLAPLIFMNGADSKAAQMFTLAHELAHVWLGATGISSASAGDVPREGTERWCNQVATELLMPMDAVRQEYQPNASIECNMQHLARTFKVSTLVSLRRLFEAGFITKDQLWQHYQVERQKLLKLNKKASSGRDFYRTLGMRASKRFAGALITSTLEGQTLFQEAYRLLGVRKNESFQKAARELGVMAWA